MTGDVWITLDPYFLALGIVCLRYLGYIRLYIHEKYVVDQKHVIDDGVSRCRNKWNDLDTVG